MGFLDHLDELRRRLFRAAVAVAIGLALSFYFSDVILTFLLKPVTDAVGQLAVIRPAEAFMNKMKAAMIGGLVLALPVIFYELWSFVAPGLYKRERRWVVPVITAGTVLFLVGALFCYAVAMPKAVGFLAEQSKGFTSMVTVDAAFGFSTKLLLAMGVVFEMPLVVFALAKLDLVTASFLWKKFDVAVFVIFVLAAIVTPTPDIITQTVFAVPMILLYAISILVAWLAAPPRA